MFDNFILIIFDPRTHENSPELRRQERVRGGPRGHIWVLDPAADTTLILRHLRGEIGFYDFKNWNIFLIFSLSTFASLLIGSRYLLDCRTQGKQELIVTINSFPDGDVDLFLTANQRTGLRLSDQWEAVQQSSYNSCITGCVIMLVSAINVILVTLPALGAESQHKMQIYTETNIWLQRDPNIELNIWRVQ